MDATAIPGAVCASHPDQPVSFTCTRCGGFACERCRAQTGGALCSACFVREGGQPLTVDLVIREGFGLAFQNLRRLLPFAAIQFAAATLMAVYSNLVMGPQSQRMAMRMAGHANLETFAELYLKMLGPLLLISLVSMVTSTVAMACELQLFGDALGGRTRGTGELFGAGLGKFLPTLGVNFLRGLGGGVLALFCCVPGVWMFVMLALAPASVVLGGKGFSGAVAEGWDLVKRRFWLILGVEAVGWVVVFGGSFVSGLFNGALKFAGTTGQVAGAVIAGAAGALLPLPLYAMQVVCFLRARAQDALQAA